jgi:ADP-ribose pyrophosphatase YjhB (NUDIX family)
MSRIATINPEQIPVEMVATYTVRSAARAVVFDSVGRIALLHVTRHGYYKLPGDGIEPGEDIVEALTRECREEIGCSIFVGESLGEVHEYRSKFSQHQISYCFIAHVEGEIGMPTFTADEVADGFTLEWYVPEQARMIMGSQSPIDYVGQFIALRDTAILELIL